MQRFGRDSWNRVASVPRIHAAVLHEHGATPVYVAGRIAVDVERRPLAQVADAWERVQRSAHRKLVLVP